MKNTKSGKAAAKAAAKVPSGSRFSPRDLLDAFLERWWIGLIFGAIAASLIIVFRPKSEIIYRTEVSLLFETRQTVNIGVGSAVDTTIQPSELNVQMEQLRSQTFFNTLINSFTPEEQQKIRDAYRDPLKPEAPLPEIAAIIRPNVVIGARKASPIVAIQVANRDPECAALIANRYARRFIDYNVDKAGSNINTTIIFLRNQAEELRAQVEAAESALNDYRVKHNMAALSGNQNTNLQKLASLSAELVKAQVAQISDKSILDRLNDYKREGKDLLELPQILDYGQIRATRESLIALRTQRALLEERYGAEHPRMKQNVLETSELQNRLNNDIQKAVNDLEIRYNLSTEYEKRVKADLTDQEAVARQLDTILVDYKFLEQEAALKRSSYTRITDKLNETIISERMQNVNIRVFDPAYVPGYPISGATELTMKAVAAGLIFFLGVPLGLGLLDSRIKSPLHVENGLNEPLLGSLKRMRGMGESERAQVFRLQKDFALAEAYRGIFSEIEVRSPIAYPKTLVITSTVPAEGKSLVSSNLSAVFAAHGRRTLLVDCDLRRPTIHRYFGADNSTGWVQWLETPSAERPERPFGIAPIMENLDLLPAGKTPKNPTELLDRLADKATLAVLLKQYDLVIFDTPPAMIFPDALFLARSCNELIYVCKFKSVRAAAIKRTISHLRDSGISILGVVLNQCPEKTLISYGYGGYGTQSAKYYKAYAEERV